MKSFKQKPGIDVNGYSGGVWNAAHGRIRYYDDYVQTGLKIKNQCVICQKRKKGKRKNSKGWSTQRVSEMTCN